MSNMEASNHGRLIEFKSAAHNMKNADSRAIAPQARPGTALIMEPRTIRHQERVEDLFYLLFRRTGS